MTPDYAKIAAVLPYQVGPTCGQCGKSWYADACGPTHAMILGEIGVGKTVVVPQPLTAAALATGQKERHDTDTQ